MQYSFLSLCHHCHGAYKTRSHPTVVESIIVDGEIGGSISGTIYPAISGSKNGAEIQIILPEGLLSLAEELLTYPVYLFFAVCVVHVVCAGGAA